MLRQTFLYRVICECGNTLKIEKTSLQKLKVIREARSQGWIIRHGENRFISHCPECVERIQLEADKQWKY